MRSCPHYRRLQASYATRLRECDDLAAAKTLYSKIQADGLQADTFLANLVVQMYAKCGSIQRALATFHSIANKNVFSYAIAITALDSYGEFRSAMDVYSSMDPKLVPDDVTNVAVLAACSKLGDLSAARALHRAIVDRGAQLATKVYNSIITMYTKCDSITDAKQTFDRVPQRNLITWNAMISANARSGQVREVLKLLREMENEGEKPDRYTFCSILTACFTAGSSSSEIPVLSPSTCSSLAAVTGKMVHDRAVLLHLETNVGVGTCLTTFYAKCGRIEQARMQFDRTTDRNVLTWNAMLAAYATTGQLQLVTELFRNMQVEPDPATYAIVLAACASSGDLEQGRKVHEKLKDSGSAIYSNSIVQNSLVNLYARCGDLEEAERVLESSCSSSSSTAAWNALMSAHVHSGDPAAAAELYKRLIQTPGVDPDSFTFSTVLGALAGLGAIEDTAIVHKEIVSRGFAGDDAVLKALVNSYAKCGNLDDAKEIFHSIKIKDTISLTSMILGYAQHCQVPQALELFKDLILEGLSPDYVTYTSILHACGHQGFLLETLDILRWMERDYGIQRTVEHYHCVIDMLARLGQLDDAVELRMVVLHEGDAVAWISLLSGLRTQLDENYQQQWTNRFSL